MQRIERKPLFDLGQLVATPGALAALEKSGQTPMDFLSRHVTGDWGELTEDDRKEKPIQLGERLSPPQQLHNQRPGARMGNYQGGPLAHHNFAAGRVLTAANRCRELREQRVASMVRPAFYLCFGRSAASAAVRHLLRYDHDELAVRIGCFTQALHELMKIHRVFATATPHDVLRCFPL
jgi:hypothetical protein